MITLPPIQITPPSDFKVKITSVTDEDGNPVDVSTRFIGFSFFVDGDRYDCISDPENDKFVNAKIEDGTLFLVFQQYPFKYGRMAYVQRQRFADAMYEDGEADWFSKMIDTNIFFVR